MDTIDWLILDRIQRAFPLVADPFESIGLGLEIDGEEVLRRIESYKALKLVRQISAIFNTGALGYQSCLVAMAVPDRGLDAAVEVINRYPGVSHNYLRPCKYNVWYTIAVPPRQSLEETVAALSREAGGWPTLLLPAIRKYKLAVVLDVLDENQGEFVQETTVPASLEAVGHFFPTIENIRVVKCVQEDLPLVKRPFMVWARDLDMEEQRLLGLMTDWVNKGIIRRFAAILNHRQAGFSANGMVVWSCPEERLDRDGKTLAAFNEVSHCYQRPAFSDWPYNLYAMIHGRSLDECYATASRLGTAIDNLDFQLLISTREFKKIRLKLFWD